MERNLPLLLPPLLPPADGGEEPVVVGVGAGVGGAGGGAPNLLGDLCDASVARPRLVFAAMR